MNPVVRAVVAVWDVADRVVHPSNVRSIALIVGGLALIALALVIRARNRRR